MFGKVHHIAIICGDYERSKAFYSNVLGFRIVRETYRAERQSYKLDLEIGSGIQIELFSFPGAPPRPTKPEAQGLRHLAFEVEDLEAATEHLRQHAVEFEPVRADELTGRRFTFFRDPDDLPLELYERNK